MKVKLLPLAFGMLGCLLADARGYGGCLPPPTGLVGWWRGEGSAEDFGDAHGTNQGGVFYTNAEVGQGFTFDSDDDRVVIPHREEFNPTSAGFTVHLWVMGQMNQPGGNALLVEKSHAYGGATGWVLQLTSGNGAVRWAIGNGGGFPELTSSLSVLDGTFHHVAGTWDGATMRLYVDGVLQADTPLTVAAPNSQSVNLGFWWGGGRNFRGQLDEVAIHGRALSPDEIVAVYAAGSAGLCTLGPPIIFRQPAHQVRLERETALFTVGGLRDEPLTYQWFKDAVALRDDARHQGASSNTLQIADLQLGDAGGYRARVANEFGAAFSAEAILTVLPNPLPSPWAAREIGLLAQPGSATYNNGIFSIPSPGTGWGASSEQFHFVYQPLPRKGGMRVRLVSVQRGAQAALMIRENLGNDACRAVWILCDPTDEGGKQRLVSRPEPGQLVYAWASPFGAGLAYPWLKLLRAGEFLSAFVSTDAIHWIFAAAVRVPMPDQVYVGMAATGSPYGSQLVSAFEQPEVWLGLEPAAELSLRREVWFERAGTAVSDLTNSPAFAEPPGLADSLRSFEVAGLGDNYGQRVSGYILAPETGPYVFHLASADAAQLWLSPDANPSRRVLIVEEPAAGSPRDWSKRVSAPVTLEAGGLYYIEALHKHGTGSDYLGVAWTLPYRPAPVNGSEPISGNHFFPQVPESVPRIVQAPSSRVAAAGLDVSFAVKAEGPPLTYQWRKDDEDLLDNAQRTGTRTPNLTLTKVRPGDAGGYTVLVRNLAGSVETTPAELTVEMPYGELSVPSLHARLEPASPSGLWLGWPGIWTALTVEMSDDLADPASWLPWDVSPQQSEGQWWVWLPTTNQQQFFRLRAASVPEPPLAVPPDPVTTAPSLPASVVTTLGKATEFLYTGPNAVQLGVTNGTIQAEQAAVVRGRVITRDGAALAGVDVRIAGHSELGLTRSRADGGFDLAVNGGGLLTVKFERSGYLAAQRLVNVPWQDYAQLEDVALVPQDSVVTRIDLDSATSVQVARGSPVADQDGARSATLLFPQGTLATMTLPDGSTQPLTTLHVRATEYTVGPNGLKAMPAELPPTVGYTYCVELGVDEADAVGAKGITFAQPIPFYVENFLGFPVGGHVPVGYYDRDRAEWVPSPNGRVIKILGQTDGRADLDLSGSNVVADTASLAALGITDDERARLAGLYAPGQTLWRVPIPHLSSWDCNWGWGPPLDAELPNIPSWLYEDPQPNKPCVAQNQVCQHSVAIPGTPYTLNYSSDRVPGYSAAKTLEIPYSHTDVPPSVKRIDLIITVNGRTFTNSFMATPNGRFRFLWDQKDAYGRQVQGCQRVTMHVGFVYDGKYQSVMDMFSAFGHNFLPDEMTVNSRQECTLWQRLDSFVGGWHSHGLGFGGWTLNQHHAYDPNSRRIYYGDGRTRYAVSTGRTINVTAGGGNNLGYDVPATDIAFRRVQGLAVAPNGELYIADSGVHRILKVDRNGIARHVAGTFNVSGFSGDGGQAKNALLNNPTRLTFGPDGSLYFCDTGNNRIRCIAPSGIITTIAGGGAPADGLGDGGTATSAALSTPMGVAMGRDGRLFIADSDHNRVRVVSPGGVIETAVGGGELLADGAAAVQSRLSWPYNVAVAPDGTLYVGAVDIRGGIYALGGWELLRIDPRGRLDMLAGGNSRAVMNGTPAREMNLGGGGLALGPRGWPYCLGWTWGMVIGEVGSDGLFRHVAGRIGVTSPNYDAYSGNGGPALAADILGVAAIAFGPDGKMYQSEADVVRNVTLPMAGVTGDSFRIPSEDGTKVYVFDESGRHLESVDALTGATLETFEYGDAGLLVSITDGDGNLTAIERAANGAPLAIVGPFGQRTALQSDANGNLSQITDPAGNTHQFASRADGLLESLTDPRTNRFNFGYDAEGRLIHEETAGCCAGDFARASANGATTVTATSPEGRQTTFASETLPTGEVRQVNTFPDGTTNQVLSGVNASRTTTFADGTVLTEQDGGDIRFGLEVPLLKTQTIRTPGGLTHSLTTDQQVLLKDAGDPMSLVGLTDIAVLNGRTNVSRYDATNRTFTSTSPEGRQTVTIVDEQARPTQLRMPGIETLQMNYDARGRLTRTAQGVRQSGLAYDATTGYLTASTNALGGTTTYQRDAVGRITALTLPDGSGWAHVWDANDNLAKLSEPNGTNHHQFTYTQQDLLETYRSPLGATETFSYNKDQELIRRQLPSGQAFEWNYAANGQLTSLRTPEGSHTFSYYPANGLLAQAISRDGQKVDFAYDGSLVTNVVWSGVVTGAIQYVFDNDLRVAQMTYAGLTLTNGFDSDGLLTNAGGINLPRNPSNGSLAGICDGPFTITYQRNEFGEITNTVAAQAAELYRANQSCDALGRITRKTETITGTSVTWNYGYDNVGQLVEVRRDGVAVEAYAYDNVGNRIGMTNTLTGEALTAGDYRYDADNKLLQAGTRTFTYDVDGRVRTMRLSGALTTYHYNTDGTIAGADLPGGRQITYLHDSRGRRIARAVNGVRTHAWLYGDGLTPLAEYDGNGAVRTTFLYGGRWTPVAFIRNGTTNHIVTDQLGSPRLVVDASGAVIKRVDYDALGNAILDTAPAFDLPFGFAGGMSDPDHELIRFGARDYQPSTGRWTAKDPILVGGGLNLYGYLANDTLNRTDRAGLQNSAGCGSADFCRFLDSLSPLNMGLRGASALLKMHAQWNYSAWRGRIERRFEEEVIRPLYVTSPTSGEARLPHLDLLRDGVDPGEVARLRTLSTEEKARILSARDIQALLEQPQAAREVYGSSG